MHRLRIPRVPVEYQLRTVRRQYNHARGVAAPWPTLGLDSPAVHAEVALLEF